MLAKEVLLIAAFIGIAIAQVPDYIHVCGRKNPHLDQCIYQSIMDLRDNLVKGMPEIDVPPIDPFLIDRVDVISSPTLTIYAENIKITGYSGFNLTHLHFNQKKLRFDIGADYKTLELDAKYYVDSKAVLPIVGKGPIHIDAEGVTSNAVMYFKMVDQGGKQYMHCVNMVVHVDSRDYTAKFQLEGESNKELNEAINMALNDRAGGLLESTRPFVEKIIAQRLIEIANKILIHFTYDELLPDHE